MGTIEKDEESIPLPSRRLRGFYAEISEVLESLEVNHSIRVTRELMTVRSYLTKHRRVMYRKDSRYRKKFTARAVVVDGVTQKKLTRVWRTA